jgi:DNA mismatch repair protein MLH1
MIGSRSEKVPVHKLVRTDSLDPAGRLHAYMKVMHGGHLEKNVTLNAVR